jgi:hypothetical protein
MPDRPRPNATPEALAANAARQAREAAALRENLKKRKEQARARDTSCSRRSRDQDDSLFRGG